MRKRAIEIGIELVACGAIKEERPGDFDGASHPAHSRERIGAAQFFGQKRTKRPHPGARHRLGKIRLTPKHRTSEEGGRDEECERTNLHQAIHHRNLMESWVPTPNCRPLETRSPTGSTRDSLMCSRSGR